MMTKQGENLIDYTSMLAMWWLNKAGYLLEYTSILAMWWLNKAEYKLDDATKLRKH